MRPLWPAKYQTLIGELLYLSVNTMPDICQNIGFVMSCLGRYMTIPTQKLGEYAKQVVRSHDAWGRRDAKLTWCQQSRGSLRPGDVGAYADSSWADVKPSTKSGKCHYILCNNALMHRGCLGMVCIRFRVSVGSSHVVSPGSLSRLISALISAPSLRGSPG